MEAKVDKDGCISCGVCVDTCPEVFRFDDNGIAEGYAEVTPQLQASAEEARDCCPVNVIDIC